MLSITMFKIMGKLQSSLGHIQLSGLNVMEESDPVKLARMFHVSPGKTGRPFWRDDSDL